MTRSLVLLVLVLVCVHTVVGTVIGAVTGTDASVDRPIVDDLDSRVDQYVKQTTAMMHRFARQTPAVALQPLTVTPSTPVPVATTSATPTEDNETEVDQVVLESDPFASDPSLPTASWTPPAELVRSSATVENNIATAVQENQKQWIAQAKAAIAALEAVAPNEATDATLAPLSDALGDGDLASGAVLPLVGAARCSGTCKATSAGCSGGTFHAGLCPGAANIQCCIPKPKPAAPAAPLGPACGRGGRCKATSTSCKGHFQAGLCAGAANIQCCLPAAPGPTGGCGAYNGASISQQKGNGGKFFGVTPIKREHLSDPSAYGKSSSQADNTILMSTACAFDSMRVAAARAGISLRINSGFRSLARQQYFWNCYQTKRCNNGNRAAVPGTSNHGIGLAIDLNAGTRSSSTYKWLAAHAHNFGFVRTVADETWHWEHRVGWRRAAYT